MTRFGDFGSLCRDTPSYPWCNLFYRQVRPQSVVAVLPSLTTSRLRASVYVRLLSGYHQLQHHAPSVLAGGPSANPKTAPVGVNQVCGIPFVGTDGSLANIANIIACGLSIIFVLYLVVVTSRRKAAVGESCFRVCYTATLAEMDALRRDIWV